jgi:hypothetical protein
MKGTVNEKLQRAIAELPPDVRELLLEDEGVHDLIYVQRALYSLVASGETSTNFTTWAGETNANAVISSPLVGEVYTSLIQIIERRLNDGVSVDQLVQGLNQSAARVFAEYHERFLRKLCEQLAVRT